MFLFVYTKIIIYSKLTKKTSIKYVNSTQKSTYKKNRLLSQATYSRAKKGQFNLQIASKLIYFLVKYEVGKHPQPL